MCQGLPGTLAADPQGVWGQAGRPRPFASRSRCFSGAVRRAGPTRTRSCLWDVLRRVGGLPCRAASRRAGWTWKWSQLGRWSACWTGASRARWRSRLSTRRWPGSWSRAGRACWWTARRCSACPARWRGATPAAPPGPGRPGDGSQAHLAVAARGSRELAARAAEIHTGGGGETKRVARSAGDRRRRVCLLLLAAAWAAAVCTGAEPRPLNEILKDRMRVIPSGNCQVLPIKVFGVMGAAEPKALCCAAAVLAPAPAPRLLTAVVSGWSGQRERTGKTAVSSV
jgi:hypothetical protein